MPIQRLQPAGLAVPVGYSHVVRASGTQIHVSGQVAFDAEGRLVGVGDLAAQTDQVFKNLQLALAAAGAQFKDVVKITTYVVNYRPADRAVIREVRSRYFTGEPPASTLVGVQALVVPELLIEVEAVAVIDG